MGTDGAGWARTEGLDTDGAGWERMEPVPTGGAVGHGRSRSLRGVPLDTDGAGWTRTEPVPTGGVPLGTDGAGPYGVGRRAEPVPTGWVMWAGLLRGQFVSQEDDGIRYQVEADDVAVLAVGVGIQYQQAGLGGVGDSNPQALVVVDGDVAEAVAVFRIADAVGHQAVNVDGVGCGRDGGLVATGIDLIEVAGDTAPSGFDADVDIGLLVADHGDVFDMVILRCCGAGVVQVGKGGAVDQVANGIGGGVDYIQATAVAAVVTTGGNVQLAIEQFQRARVGNGERNALEAVGLGISIDFCQGIEIVDHHVGSVIAVNAIALGQNKQLVVVDGGIDHVGFGAVAIQRYPVVGEVDFSHFEVSFTGGCGIYFPGAVGTVTKQPAVLVILMYQSIGIGAAVTIVVGGVGPFRGAETASGIVAADGVDTILANTIKPVGVAGEGVAGAGSTEELLLYRAVAGDIADGDLAAAVVGSMGLHRVGTFNNRLSITVVVIAHTAAQGQSESTGEHQVSAANNVCQGGRVVGLLGEHGGFP